MKYEKTAESRGKRELKEGPEKEKKKKKKTETMCFVLAAPTPKVL
jgi:hypothetical protein